MSIDHGANIWFAAPWSVYCPAVHATFFTFVTPGGTLDVLRVDDGTLAETWLGSFGSTGYSANDHYSGALILLPNGKIVWFAITPTGNDLVYRILDPVTGACGPTNPMGLQAQVGTYQLSYAQPLYNSLTNRLAVAFQQINTPAGNTWCIASNFDMLASNTWSAGVFWHGSVGCHGTYLRSASNGLDRMDFLLTDGIPTDEITSSYHVVLKAVSSTVTQWQDSFGNNIGAQSNVSMSTATKVIDGASVGNLWIWDMAYDPSGAPVALHVTYPGNNPIDMRYRVAHFNGAWTSAEVCKAANRSLDDRTNVITVWGQNRQYAPGACFDANDARRIFACCTDDTGHRVEVRATADYTTWTLEGLLSAPETGSTHKKARPTSPKGYVNGSVQVAWGYGYYFDYNYYVPPAEFGNVPGGFDMVLTLAKAPATLLPPPPPTVAQLLASAGSAVAADISNTATVQALGTAIHNFAVTQ